MAVTTARSAAPLLSQPRAAGPTVCVDLDGTLLAGDLLWEAFVDLVKRAPLKALGACVALLKGKAAFKRTVARLMPIDPALLPYREALVEELRRRRAAGEAVVLATAADDANAQAVADHLGIFTDVVASDGQTNLSGRRKAEALVARYGAGGFSYFGNGWSDVPVWQAARGGRAVAAPPALVRLVNARQLVDEVTEPQPGTARALLKAMRPYQWVKNVLVFVPVLASHNLLRLDLWIASALAFLVFSLSASAIYILNDISDIAADRLHPRKRKRPFASGALTIPFGIACAVLLLLPGLALAFAGISWQLGLTAVAYVAATTAYSVALKRRAIVDVFTLTSLYVLRIVAGGTATGITLSTWLLAFALFFFLSLAFVKRYSEVIASAGWLAGRGYCQDDGPWLQGIGTAAGYMAVVILVLYISAPEVAILYSRPKALWLLCPLLLFWVTRLWFRAARRVVTDDPVLEALKDGVSYLTAAAGIVILLAAL